MRPALRLLAAVLAAAAIAGCGASPGRPLHVAAYRLPRSVASHVVLIVMENKEAGQVLGSPDAPYLTRLAGRSGLATHSYGVRHPSLPNYLALTSGSTHGIASDCTSCLVGGPDLVDQLEAAHRTWRTYLEDLPRPCFTGASAGGYAKKHDPFAYYRDVVARPVRCRRIVPLGRLAGALRRDALPDFAFIAPNLCDDTHDCGVGTGDRFLARVVPALMRELGPRGMLVLTWDEGTSDTGCCDAARGGRIATIVAGPGVRAGARSSAPVDHYGTLRTIEDTLGVGHLGGAADPRNGSLHALFRREPRVR